MLNPELKVNDIFQSISGECSPVGQGAITTFVRLSGCESGKCSYCDTDHFKFKVWKSRDLYDHIVYETNNFGNICFTGGEPLEQPKGLQEVIAHLKWLNPMMNNYNVWVETNGIMPLLKIKGIDYVMDYKYHNPPLLDNYIGLSEDSMIKFLINSKKEFDQMIDLLNDLKTMDIDCKTIVVGTLWKSRILHKTLLKWLLKEINNFQHFKFFLNTQVHKYIDIK